MNQIEKLEFRWNNYVEKIYLINDDFDYKKAKKLSKELLQFEKYLISYQNEINTTLSLSNFNSNDNIENELIEINSFIINLLSLLKNITSLSPQTKQGYYNYIKNAIAFI